MKFSDYETKFTQICFMCQELYFLTQLISQKKRLWTALAHIIIDLISALSVKVDNRYKSHFTATLRGSNFKGVNYLQTYSFTHFFSLLIRVMCHRHVCWWKISQAELQFFQSKIRIYFSILFSFMNYGRYESYIWLIGKIFRLTTWRWGFLIWFGWFLCLMAYQPL